MKPRSPEETALVQRAYAALPGGTLGNVVQSQESAFLIREARGSKLYDFSGNEFIDYLMGSGPLVLGHSHPAVTEAVRWVLDQGSTYFHTNWPAVELAEEIIKAVPCADQVRFTTSGTDATYQCIRLARAHTKRAKVLKFEGGFHGMHDYSLVSLAPRPEQLQDYPEGSPTSAGIPQAVLDSMLVAPFNDLERTADLLRAHHQEVAAVIVEPFQRILTPAPGFLQGLRELTSQYGIVLIFDEVVTGFRLAYGGAQEYYGVTPDLAAYGKIIGGGFPLAAVAGPEALMRHYNAAAVPPEEFVPQIGTLSGNPLAAVAGLATLAVLRKPGQYQALHEKGRRLQDALHDALAEAELPHHVSGEPVNFDVYFTEQPVQDYRGVLSNNKQLAAAFNQGLRERNIYKPYEKFYMSLAHTEDDLQRTMTAFREVAQELRQVR